MINNNKFKNVESWIEEIQTWDSKLNKQYKLSSRSHTQESTYKYNLLVLSDG